MLCLQLLSQVFRRRIIELKDTTESVSSVSYLDILHERGIDGNLTT